MSNLKLVDNTYKPERLERWTLPSSYAGPSFDEYYIVIGQNRDSDILSQSNFESALNELGGETETVRVIRQGHWACGWIELLMIHESDIESLIKADKMMKDYDNYPVIDEQHYSDLEYETYSKYAEEDKESLGKFLTEVFSIPEELESDTEEIAYYLNLESQLKNGEDSCFNYNIYHFRSTGDFDTEDLEDIITDCDIERFLENNKALKYLKAVLGIDHEN